MDFAYSAEQEQFRASLRRFLADHAPSVRVREVAAAGGHDAPLWQRLCTELGIGGVGAPEEYGGAGGTLVETAIVAEELGRGLTPVPLVATASAIEAVLRLGDESSRKELLPGLLSGERIGALAIAGPDAVDPAAATVRAGGGRLTGECAHVLHGDVADLLVVPALDADAVALFVVDRAAAGVTVTPRPALDPTRPVAAVALHGAPAVRLGGALEQVERFVDVARVLLAAEMLGSAAACLDMAVAHAKARLQFNRPIGSFQAVKHRCAELAIELDATRAAVMFAALAAATDDPELAVAGPLAKAQAADTFLLCARSTIQIHGGIGFTWEHDAHLYLRRATTTAALFGSSAQHRALLAARAGI